MLGGLASKPKVKARSGLFLFTNFQFKQFLLFFRYFTVPQHKIIKDEVYRNCPAFCIFFFPRIEIPSTSKEIGALRCAKESICCT